MSALLLYFVDVLVTRSLGNRLYTKILISRSSEGSLFKTIGTLVAATGSSYFQSDPVNCYVRTGQHPCVKEEGGPHPDSCSMLSSQA